MAVMAVILSIVTKPRCGSRQAMPVSFSWLDIIGRPSIKPLA